MNMTHVPCQIILSFGFNIASHGTSGWSASYEFACMSLVVRWVCWRERESQHCLSEDRLYST